VRRNATSTAVSGASKFNYSTVLEHLAASVQDAGGRMRQDEFGQVPIRKASGVFGPEASGVLQQNDLLVLENIAPGQTYRVVHLHRSAGPGGSLHHVEAALEQVVTEGGD
jgi:hypothetical protein